MDTRAGISIGYNCWAALYGIKKKLRLKKVHGYKTCPFDICITNYEGILKCIEDDFKYFTDPLHLKLIDAPFSVGSIIKNETDELKIKTLSRLNFEAIIPENIGPVNIPIAYIA